MGNLENLFFKYGSDLVTDAEEEYLDKELKDNYKDILIRIQSKLKETGLPPQIGIFPLLMDFYVNKDFDLNIGLHHSYNIDLDSTSMKERYLGPKMTPLNFEIFAYRLIELYKKQSCEENAMGKAVLDEEM